MQFGRGLFVFLKRRQVLVLAILLAVIFSSTSLIQAGGAVPELSHSKLVAFPAETLEPGTIQSYSLTITNSGTSSANNVKVHATIDNNIQILNVTEGDFDAKTNNAFWTLANLPVGRSITLSFMGRVKDDVAIGEKLDVKMYVQSAELHEQMIASQATTVKSLPEGPQPKLVTFQTIDSSNPQPGEEVTFHVIINNEGQQAAQGVIAREQLPPELELLPDMIHPHLSNFARSSEPELTYDKQTNRLQVRVASLMPHEWVALMFSARVRPNAKVGQEITTQANVQANVPKFDTLAPVKFNIAAPAAANATVSVNVDKSNASPGDKLTYTITVNNQDSAAVSKLKIIDSIPQGLTLVNNSSTTSCGLKVVESSGQVLWKKGTLPAAANGTPGSCVVSFQATVNSGISNGTMITDMVSIKAPSGLKLSGSATTSVQNSASTASVDLMDNFFSPAVLSVPAGTVVTWTDRGNNPHTVSGATCNPINFSSDSMFPNGLRNGDKFSFTVPADAKSGSSIYYFCRFHGAPGSCNTVGPGMAGIIMVK